MGKRLIIQRRGRGTPTYKSASHRFKGRIAYRYYDDIEKEGSLKGRVVDIIHDPGRSAPLAQVQFENDEKLLILAPESIQIDDEITVGVSAPISTGNSLPLLRYQKEHHYLILKKSRTAENSSVHLVLTFLITHDVGKAILELPSGN